MQRMSSIVAGALAATLSLIPARGEGTPLPHDDRPVMGTLDNGLSYIIRKHDNPPGRAAVWMHVSSGSLNETDKQRGIAHYLEHMAFNGSENFPPGTVIDFFQSMGLSFGQHQNAFTSFDQTTYQLALPDNKPETLDKAMTFMSDVAGKLSLLPKEIDDERQIILEERRTRLSGRQRVQDYFFEHLAPGSIFGQRIPIGTEETVKGVQEPDFRDYYGKWYVPSNITVMVVADMDPGVVAEQIKTRFGSGKKVAKPKDQEIGVKPYAATRAIVASDKEVTDASLGLIWLYPPKAPTTTVELFRADLVENIGHWIFNRRMEQKVAEGKVSFQGGGAGGNDLYRAAYLATVNVRGEPAKWEQMLRDVATEVRRANLHGFTEQEVADARKELLADAERGVETEKTRNARVILNEMNSAVSQDEPMMSAQQELDLDRQLLPGITKEQVNARFNEAFDASKPVCFSLQLPSSEKVPSEAELISMGQQAMQVKPEADSASERPKTLLVKAPEGGKVVSSSEHAASKVTTAWLSNDIPVNYRFMDYKKDEVTVTITLATGDLYETAENRGITAALAIAWNRPATSTLSSTNIRDIMTGKKVAVRGGPSGPDSVTLSISGSPADLETGMQLAYLLLTDPVIEKPAFEQLKQIAKLQIQQRSKDIQAYALGEVLPKLLYPSDEARFMPLSQANIDALTLEKCQAWIKEKVLPAPIEVSVVGEIDQAKAMDLVQKYIGSLPKRSQKISNGYLAEMRHVKRPTGPLVKDEKFPTATDKAVVASGFFGPDSKDLADTRLFQMASRVLSTRAIQEIREKQQLAYSPGVGYRPSPAVPGYATMTLASTTEPGKVEAFKRAIHEMFDAFSKDGATSEEMETAKKQFATNWDEQMREPGYWSQVLSTLHYRWLTLDDVLAGPDAFQKMTGDEVKAAFNKYYSPQTSYTMTCVPDAAVPESKPKGQ
jgi:zinc protease